MKMIPSLKHLFYGILIFASCATCPVFAGRKHKRPKTVDYNQIIKDCIDTSQTSMEAWKKLKEEMPYDSDLANPEIEARFHLYCQYKHFIHQYPALRAAQQCVNK